VLEDEYKKSPNVFRDFLINKIFQKFADSYKNSMWEIYGLR